MAVDPNALIENHELDLQAATIHQFEMLERLEAADNILHQEWEEAEAAHHATVVVESGCFRREVVDEDRWLKEAEREARRKKDDHYFNSVYPGKLTVWGSLMAEDISDLERAALVQSVFQSSSTDRPGYATAMYNGLDTADQLLQRGTAVIVSNQSKDTFPINGPNEGVYRLEEDGLRISINDKGMHGTPVPRVFAYTGPVIGQLVAPANNPLHDIYAVKDGAIEEGLRVYGVDSHATADDLSALAITEPENHNRHVLLPTEAETQLLMQHRGKALAFVLAAGLEGVAITIEPTFDAIDQETAGRALVDGLFSQITNRTLANPREHGTYSGATESLLSINVASERSEVLGQLATFAGMNRKAVEEALRAKLNEQELAVLDGRASAMAYAEFQIGHKRLARVLDVVFAAV